MVEMSDAAVAVLGAAFLVAHSKELGQLAIEQVRLGVHRHQLAGLGARVEAAYPLVDAGLCEPIG